MPQGDKSKYTDKQKRQTTDIERSYEKRGVIKTTAKKRAWTTVNKMSAGASSPDSRTPVGTAGSRVPGGGKKSGSGRGKPVNSGPAKKGGKKSDAAPKRAGRAKK